MGANRHKKGVTVIEVMVVVAIIGIIMTLIYRILFGYAPPSVRLERVVINNRSAKREEIRAIQIIRNGQNIEARIDMKLQNYDEIKTDGKTTVVLYLRGTNVILKPDTHVEIVASSRKIHHHLGEIFVHVQGKTFDVETRYVVAGVEGTEFLVKVNKSDIVSVTVLDGLVRLKSKSSNWNSVELEEYQRAIISAKQPPQISSGVQQSWGRQIRQWAISTGSSGDTKCKKNRIYTWFYNAAVQHDLKLVIDHQTVYKAIHGSYTSKLPNLEIDFSPLIPIEITTANEDYFKAKAKHRKAPGCVWTIDSNGNFEAW